MDSLSSPAPTVPSLDEYFEHNVWNPLLELLFLEQVSGIFASFVVEIDLVKIALSCHFALDLLCYKEGAHESPWRVIGHYCPWILVILCGTIVTPVASWSILRLTPLLHNFAPRLVLRSLVLRPGTTHTRCFPSCTRSRIRILLKNYWNLSYTAPLVRVVHRGRDPHPHGQVFLLLGIRWHHLQRCLAEPLFTNEKRGANSRSLLWRAGPWAACFLWPISWRLSCLSVWCLFSFSHQDCMMSRRRPTAIPPSTPCLRCRRLESTNRAVMLSVMYFLLSEFQKVLEWHHCHQVIADFWTRQSRLSLFFPRAFIFSFLTTNACCLFHSARATFTTTDGKVAKSARCCPLGPSRCFATCSWFQWRLPLVHGFNEGCHVFMVSMKVCSPFFCLAHAFVCSISPVFSAGHCVHPLLSVVATGIPKPCVFLLLILLDWFCTSWHVPGGFRQPSRNVSSSVVEIWRSSYVKLFLGSPCPSLHVSAPFSIIYSGYAWARSKCFSSWCVECAFDHCG